MPVVIMEDAKVGLRDEFMTSCALEEVEELLRRVEGQHRNLKYF
jgi:hypothetical protein